MKKRICFIVPIIITVSAFKKDQNAKKISNDFDYAG